MSDSVIFHQNPKLDYLFGYFGKVQVRTNQDKYKPINVAIVNDDGGEEILKDFYIKNPDSQSIQDFKNLIQKLAKGYFREDNKIQKPYEVEIVLSVTMSESRFKQVDVDNIAKTILDSLNDIVFEDDSQVSSLIVNKSIHPMKVDSLLIGITKLTANRRGFIDDIYLFKENK
ncbi:RusA family crossover junction endodeoxyribonuclease [Pontibacter burrus]|uniref:RusA family crossover junction endodeoxyribonuclease n=1 Tax=Pontibacter burrus TaxID=2704466 RepID=A0A6B3LJE7_9BACT|nr:RusA family crossover junction endodeoxyribonuclease [Pontibacter burrus]NEM96809.1 RusA family crossover junction endodeoxyribonuclease [Pontibacter burrus]